MIDVRPVDIDQAKSAGELLASASASDVVDALVAQLAMPADQILTSDPDDLNQLITARGVAAIVIPV